MKIDSLKELQKIIALCRKTGVQSIKIDGIELQLGSVPTAQKSSKSKQTIDYSRDFPESQVQVPQYQATEPEDISPEEQLSEEQLMFYSSSSEESVQ